MLKFLSESEIENELNDYIYNVKIKYATLLNGSWGSGKTFFIKKYIEELDQKYKENKDKKDSEYKKPIYISLYGLNSVSDIKNKILNELIENETIKKALPFIPVVTDIFSDVIEKTIHVKKPKDKLYKIYHLFRKVDDSIIFFDDLERCDLNINTILGYINELVEHKNIKVIIVADENKIGKVNFQNNIELKYLTSISNNIKTEDKQNKKDSRSMLSETNRDDDNNIFTKEELDEKTKYLFSEDIIYNEIKEKLIGKVIYYRADISSVYDKFIDAILTNSNAKKIAENNKKAFLNQLENENHYNLRTVQFIFQCFNRLVKETENIIKNKDIENIFFNNLFFCCIIKSIDQKQGKNPYNWESNQEIVFSYSENAFSNYTNGSVTKFKFIDDYIDNSYFDKVKTKNTLENYENMILDEMNHPNDPLYKLNKLWHIPENKLETIIDELIEKIKSNKYSLGSYRKIVYALSCIEEMGVCNDKIKKAIRGLKENIEKGDANGAYDEDSVFYESPDVSEIYRNNIKEIEVLVKQKEKSDDKKLINDILKKDNWGKCFKEYCKKNNNVFMQNKSFASILNIDDIIENIKNKDIEQIYEFWYALQNVYDRFADVKYYYTADIDVLKDLKNKLKDIDSIDKVRKFVTSNIYKYLEVVIKKLQ